MDLRPAAHSIATQRLTLLSPSHAARAGRRADANVRARRLADTFVRDFRCGKDKRRMTASGSR